MKKIKLLTESQPYYTVKKVKNGVYYTLTRDYILVGNYDKISFAITFKSGYTIDGASVPRFAWSIVGVNPGGMALMPALFHDLLYMFNGDTCAINLSTIARCNMSIENRRVLVLDRKTSDLILKALMYKNGFNKAQCNACYVVLRLFGKPYWGRGYKKI